MYLIFLLLLIPFKYTPTYVFLFSLSLIFILTKVRISKLESYEYLFIIYFTYSLSSILFSSDIQRSFSLVLFDILFILSYIFLFNYFKKINLDIFLKKLYTSLKIYIYFSTLYFLFGVVAYYFLNMQLDNTANIFGLHVDDIRPRFNGLATSPSSYGLIAIIFTFMNYTNYPHKKLDRVIAYLTMFLTISLTVYLAFLVSHLIYLFMQKRILRLLKLSILVGLLTLIASYVIVNNEILYKILEYRLDNLRSGTHRFYIWEEAFRYIGDDLFFGKGYNYSPIFLKHLMGENALSSLHNVYIQILFEQGIFGLMLFSFFMYSLIKSSYIIALKDFHLSFILYAFIAFFIEMNSAIIIYSPNFLLLIIIVKKLNLNIQEKR